MHASGSPAQPPSEACGQSLDSMSRSGPKHDLCLLHLALSVRLLVHMLHVVNVSLFRDDQAFSIRAKVFRPAPPRPEKSLSGRRPVISGSLMRCSSLIMFRASSRNNDGRPTRAWPVSSSKARHPKLQTWNFGPTGSLRIVSGALRARGVVISVGLSLERKAINTSQRLIVFTCKVSPSPG